jgi:CHAD domain-containing protein/uncharacterized protein YjbK
MTSKNKIETEAKFIIAEGSTFAALQRLTKLGEFRLEPRGTRLITDRYLDTPQMHLYRSGYACRIRTKDDQRIVTLKSLTPAEGNVHRRQEIEQIVQSDEPKNWGDGESTRIIKDLAGDTALTPLFVIHQTRHIRYANLQDKTVIECSLDEVSLNETTRVDYYNLEAELLEAGQEADLSQFIETLQTKWLLRPEGLSKFERGLININQRMEGKPQKLNQLEKITLNQLAKTENKHIARRAEIILMVNADISDADIAQELGLTTQTIQKWKRRFEKKRLEIFPEELIHTMLVKETAMPRLNQSELTPPDGESGSAVPPASLTKDSVPLYPVRESIGLTPTDTMAEAGRKVLGFHFARMLQNEPGTRLGEDIEALHDMRVATRRMRAALQIFGAAYVNKKIKPIARGLKLTGRALGRVRDMDVFLQKLEVYRQSLPVEEQAGVDPIIDTWQIDREKTRQEMLAYLDSKTYTRFKKDFLNFVRTEEFGAKPIPKNEPVPYQLRHIVPRIVYTRYEETAAYDTILNNASLEMLHNLRLSCKILRYTIEFFGELLGPESKLVIKEIKAMQDHLGNLNDADVAGRILRDYLTRWEEHQLHLPLVQRESPNQVVGYLTTKLNERHHLSVTFPQAWTIFNQPDLRRNLALSVAAL